MARRTPLLGLMASGALLLAACGGSDANSSADTTATSTDSTTTTTAAMAATDPPATDPPATDPPATAPVVTEPLAADPPATDAPSDVDGTCLVGDWVVTEDEMNNFYEAVTATLSAPVTITVEGSAPLSMNADGTYRWAPTFTLTVEVAGTMGTGETSGDIVGEWTAIDGIVTTASDVNALDVSVTVGGATIDGSDMANGFLNSSPVNGVTYSCEGATPVLDFQTGDADVTVPVTLTPA